MKMYTKIAPEGAWLLLLGRFGAGVFYGGLGTDCQEPLSCLTTDS